MCKELKVTVIVHINSPHTMLTHYAWRVSDWLRPEAIA